ncbi:MAG TPA: hypothetical protein VHD61_06550 [Lacunisphaera sp.]|nr:hypothetical protein [Lacunisphaera sp.]
MPFPRLMFIVSGLVALSAVAGPAAEVAFPGQQRKWSRYQSPHFELYSANSDRASREILEKLELLRAVVLDTFKLQVRLPEPVTIYSFDREQDFRGYLPPERRKGDVPWAGFCRSDPDRTVIMLAPAASHESAAQVVYHEFIHYLFRITEQTPAPWFNEGAAELFSTMEENGDWLELGQPIAGRVAELRQGDLLPFDQLFGATYDSPLFQNDNHTGRFYAQAWAFLHYCCFGVNGVAPEKMSAFLRIAGSPQMPALGGRFEAVCRDLLGCDYAGLHERLHGYIETGRFVGRRTPRPKLPARSTYPVRPVPDDELATRLAELSLRYAREPYARWFILRRAEQVPEARLCELLGTIALQAGESDTAREQWKQAMALGGNNAAVYHELGRLESRVVTDAFTLDYQLPVERGDWLRQLLAKSIEYAPDQSMAYEQLAWVEAASAKANVANVNLVQQRFNALTNRPRALLALIVVRLRLGDGPGALHLLDSLDKMESDGWVAFWAEMVRARAEQRPPRREVLDAAARKSVATLRLELPKVPLPH